MSKTAIVTGAASGIGSAVALLLAQAGYRLLLTGRSPQKLEAAAGEVARLCPQAAAALTQVAELGQPAQVHDLVHRAEKEWGRLDALANIAGSASLLPIAKVTEQHWRDTIDSNLSYVVHITAAAFPLMVRSGGGVIVNVSSLASVDPFPLLGIYAAAKAGLNMFTLVTAREGAPHNIRAVCVAPGAVETPLLRRLFDEEALPTERTLGAQTVAQLLVQCITGERAFDPGQTIFLPSP